MGLPLQRGGTPNDMLIRLATDAYSLASRTGGQVFFVDGTDGSDDVDNPGTSYYSPVLTITRANALCTASHGDIVQILKNSPSSPPGDETFPVALNKQGMILRGTLGARGGMLSDSGFGSDEQNVAAIEVGAHYITIEDLYLGVDNLGSTGGIVEFNGTNSYFGTTIRRCTFETQYIPAYGIYVIYDQPYLLVEDCVFGRYDIAGYTTAGIYIGNLTAGMLRRNVFNACAGIGISAGAQASNFSILDNRFSLPSDTVGKAITLANGSSGIYVNGNCAAFGIVDPTTNPFRDLNNDNSNMWGLNCKGVTATLPIGT